MSSTFVYIVVCVYNTAVVGRYILLAPTTIGAYFFGREKYKFERISNNRVNHVYSMTGSIVMAFGGSHCFILRVMDRPFLAKMSNGNIVVFPLYKNCVSKMLYRGKA